MESRIVADYVSSNNTMTAHTKVNLLARYGHLPARHAPLALQQHRCRYTLAGSLKVCPSWATVQDAVLLTLQVSLQVSVASQYLVDSVCHLGAQRACIGQAAVASARPAKAGALQASHVGPAVPVAATHTYTYRRFSNNNM
jgi:hypothetical protein